ncbi:MAG: tetratricopeptide repeat protein [Phycisphaerales bacterium]
MPSPAFQAAVQQMQSGRLDVAEQTLRRQLAKQPSDPDATSLLGAVLTQLGRFDQAEFLFKRGLAAYPNDYSLLGNYGNLCLFWGKFAQARQHFEAALKIVPDGMEALLGLGPTLYSLGEIDAAVAISRRAREVAPHDPAAAANLGASLTAAGLVKEATQLLRIGLASAPHKPSLVSNYLGTLNYDPDLSDQFIRSEHVRVCQWLAGGAPAGSAHARPVPKNAQADRVLRVGFVSADFRAHAVAWFIRAIVEHLDAARVQAFAYFNGTRDATSEALRPLFRGGWFDCLGVSDDRLVERIKADQIDILFDLSGHTDGTRLSMFRKRAAPVQATYLGYPNTTGLPEMDFRLVDAHTDPMPAGPAADASSVPCDLATDPAGPATERYIRLDRCFLCYTPPTSAPDPGPLPRDGAGHITFISCNAGQKLNPRLFALWGRILEAVPGSRLVIKHRGLSSAGVLDMTRQWLAEARIDAARVELIGWMPDMASHLHHYLRADIALDSAPYNGTTTTCEALFMGVPVIGLRGGTHAGRVGVSLLTTVGVPELLADDADGYVRLASELAADRARLVHYRATLRQRMVASPLCDGPGMARAFERACQTMWRAALWATTPSR